MPHISRYDIVMNIVVCHVLTKLFVQEQSIFAHYHKKKSFFEFIWYVRTIGSR